MPHPYTKLLISLNYAYLAAYENEKNSIIGIDSTRMNIEAKIRAVDIFIDIIENGASHPHAIERETIIKSKRLGDLYLLLVAQDSSLDKKTIQNINNAGTPRPHSRLRNTPEAGTLHHAASTSIDAVKELLKRGAYLNMLDEAGEIPISRSASADIALELLRNGSNYMSVYESGYQFLMDFGDSMTDVNATI